MVKFHVSFIYSIFLTSYVEAFIYFLSTLFDHLVRKIDYNAYLFNFVTYLNTSSNFKIRICLFIMRNLNICFHTTLLHIWVLPHHDFLECII